METGFEQHCPCVRAKFGMDDEVRSHRLRVTVVTWRQPGTTPGHSADHDRHGEAKSTVRLKDASAFHKCCHWIFNVLKRVRMKHQIKAAVIERKAAHVVFRII